MIILRTRNWLACLLLLGFQMSASASIVYLYDFPGTPGSGLAANQTNPEPASATFGDWKRVNVSQLPTTNVFDSNYWNNSSTFNPAQYVSFSITATAGVKLTLTQVAFDEMRGAGGPTHGRVSLFLNGSTTAYASYNYNPASQVNHEVFNFFSISNITSAEFRFYGWNGGTPAAGLLFDNVATPFSFTGTPVPEGNSWLAGLIPMTIAVVQLARDWRSRRV